MPTSTRPSSDPTPRPSQLRRVGFALLHPITLVIAGVLAILGWVMWMLLLEDECAAYMLTTPGADCSLYATGYVVGLFMVAITGALLFALVARRQRMLPGNRVVLGVLIIASFGLGAYAALDAVHLIIQAGAAPVTQQAMPLPQTVPATIPT